MNKLTIFINEQPVYEYDKTITINPEQIEFLDKMDRDMARGLKINGELIKDPDTRQRATFIAMNLIKSLLQDDEAKTTVSCAYLANRLPGIIEVHARDQDGAAMIDLIENKPT